MKCKITTEWMRSGGNSEVFHAVQFNVIVGDETYLLQNDYDINNYLLEAEWIGKEYEEMDAWDFTEMYTLDMTTGRKERTVDGESVLSSWEP